MTTLVAALQLDLQYGQKRLNTENLLSLIDSATSSGAALVVAPEMANTGYIMADTTAAKRDAEPLDGPLVAELHMRAQRSGALICVGFCEIDPVTQALYNSAVLVGPDGVLLHHRKMHPYVCDPLWASDGVQPPRVYEAGFANISIAICADVDYPETTLISRRQGAEILALPTCWIGERAPSSVWLSRAYESGMYLVAADSCGNEAGHQFSGGSCIISPSGNVLSSRDVGEGIVFAEVDVDSLRRARRSPQTTLHTDPTPSTFTPDQLSMDLIKAGLVPDLLRPSYTWDISNTDAIHRSVGRPTTLPARDVAVTVVQFTADRLPQGRLQGAALDQIISFVSTTLDGLTQRGQGAKDQVLVLPSLTPNTYDVSGAKGAVEDSDGLVARLGEAVAPESGVLITGWTALCGCGRPRFDLFCISRTAPTQTRTPWSSAHSCSLTPPNLPIRPFQTALGTIGVISGFEALTPLSVRMMAIDHAWLVTVTADLAQPAPIPLELTNIPHPASVKTDRDPTGLHIMRQRAAENNTFLAFANTASPAGFGYSGVFAADLDPDRSFETLLDSDSIGYTTKTIRFPAADSATYYTVNKPMLRMRRTSLYGSLLA